MACFIFPARLVIVLFVLLYFVLLFCCHHVSCVLVNVTRNGRDTFSYPGVFKDCSGFCLRRKSYVSRDLTKIGICICECTSNYRTFVTSELKCVKDRDIRNTRQSSLKFKLYEYEQPDGPLKVEFFYQDTTILFQPPNLYNEVCDLNNIEQLNHVGQWISVKNDLSNYSIIEIDDDDIERRFTWLDMKYEGWMMLKLRWGVSPGGFTGRIMKIIVTCENSKKHSRHMTGEMAFKVHGMFTSSAPASPTTYYLTSALSTTSSVFANSTASMIPSIVMTSSPFIPMTLSSFQPMISSSVESMTSSSLQSMMSSSLQPMMSSSLETMTSSSLGPMMSSSLQPMTSSSLEPMTSSSLQTMISSSLETMTSSTMSPPRSSMNVVTETVIYSSTSSMVLSSSSMVPSSSSMVLSSSSMVLSSSSMVLSSSSMVLNSSSMVLSSSSMVLSSSMTMVGPVKTSKSSSNGAVTGGIAAGLVGLLVVVVLIVYVFKKRRLTVIRPKKHSDLGHINPNYKSLSNLHIYENPELVNPCSGITSIDSAAYDSCIVVENPSAGNDKVRSVYDNIPDPAENTYKALDPTKREPSAKYQSLIKREYSTVDDHGYGSSQEPLYSEVDRLPSPRPRRNGHGTRGPTPPPLTSRKPTLLALAEPMYNELENNGSLSRNQNFAPSLPPRTHRTSAAAEPIYNELENSGSQAQETENGLEESDEVHGENGPVYSVLEEN